MGKRRRGLAYRIVARADASFVRGPSADGQSTGHAGVFLKEGYDASPYCVPNEYICGRIGGFLGLPIPPCELVRIAGNRFAFALLDFNYERESMPPVIPELCVTHQLLLSTGILLFDILIANEDRHDQNLVADNMAEPKRIVAFDHDQALFGGGGQLRGIDRLEAIQMRLGIGVPGGLTGGTGHCLLPHIGTAEHFAFWLDRIADIPKWVFEDACIAAAQTGIGQRWAERAADFLFYRSRHLTDIIMMQRAAFTSITTWPDFGGLIR